MRLSCGIVASPNAPEIAALAEELGYHRAWFYDSPALYGAVWIAIARTLDRTERIGVDRGARARDVRPHSRRCASTSWCCALCCAARRPSSKGRRAG